MFKKIGIFIDFFSFILPSKVKADLPKDMTGPMTREQKGQVIKDLTAQLNDNSIIYLADISTLNAGSTSDLRRACFKANVKLNVVKNTLLAKAMENTEKDFGGLSEVLKGNTSIMISETGNAPAKVIQEFRKKTKGENIVKKQIGIWNREKILNLIFKINDIELIIKKNLSTSTNIITDFILEQTDDLNSEP
mgnify:CR=1 FL=1